jgi:hypothetical protein
MLSHTMKLALIAVGTATLIANPAFARTAPKHTLATEAFASVSEMPGSLGGVYMVVGWDGRVVGADPDRNIRFQLMRDAFANEN